jgi:hypothetical protein
VGVDPVTEYSIYRRIDTGFKGSNGSDLTGWDFLLTVPADLEDQYSAVVPTIADSSQAGGIHYSSFLIRSRTANVGTFFDSPPDSGYSIDNIAPGVPTNVVAAYLSSSVNLSWDDVPETDFQFYRVYRDTDPGFTPTPGNLIHETAIPAWVDPTVDPWGYHYKVTALDYAGNESDPGEPASVTGVSAGGIPVMTALLGAVPNPFNPSTRLSFDMAHAGHVRLAVYDVAGRLVTALVDEHRETGRYDVAWDGRDANGRTSSAGVYLYRLEADGVIETKRMLLVK